jgi:hypothetical protein
VGQVEAAPRVVEIASQLHHEYMTAVRDCVRATE